MSASVYLRDEEFDALVDMLEALANRHDAKTVARWEIRMALGGHGVLPEGAGADDGLLATLRSVCGRDAGGQRAA